MQLGSQEGLPQCPRLETHHLGGHRTHGAIQDGLGVRRESGENISPEGKIPGAPWVCRSGHGRGLGLREETGVGAG